MEPALKGQVPRRGFASRPSVFLWTPYGPGRFKGPFGSPLFVPTFTHVASASRSRPHRFVSFRRRAILRRFVPYPRKMAKRDGSCSQKPRTRSRTGGAVSSRLRRNPPYGFSFHKRINPPVPFKRQERTRSAVAALGVPRSRDWCWRAARDRASHRHRSGLKIPPRPLSAPVTPLASMASQPHKRARRAALINAVSPHQFSPFGIPLS